MGFCANAADSAATTGAQPSYEGKSEYYTQDEMSAMFKPKKKKVPAHPRIHPLAAAQLEPQKHVLLCMPQSVDSSRMI